MDREKIPVWAISITNGTKAIELITKAAAEMIQSPKRLFSFGGVEQDEEGAENLTASVEVKEQVLISGGEDQTETKEGAAGGADRSETAECKREESDDDTQEKSGQRLKPTPEDEKILQKIEHQLRNSRGNFDKAFFSQGDSKKRSAKNRGYQRPIENIMTDDGPKRFFVGFTKKREVYCARDDTPNTPYYEYHQ